MVAEIKIKDDIRGICYENGKLYMVTLYINAIITYDLQTKKIGVLGYGYPKNNVFEKILKCGDKLYLFPALGDGIYYYDMKNRKYQSLILFDSIKDNVVFSNRTFFQVFEYEQLIYAVCRHPNVIICIDPLNDAVQVYHLSEKLLKSNPMIIEHFPVCICDKKLVYAYSSNIEIEFSLTDKEFKIVHLTEEEDGHKTEYNYIVYGMLLSDSGDRWLFNLYGDLFRIVDNKKVRVEIPDELAGAYDDGSNAEQYKINQVILIKDKIYFIPQFDNRILIYDLCTNEFVWCENHLAHWEENRRRITYIVWAQMNANSYLLYHYNNSAIYVWNIEEGFTDKIELKLSVEEIINNAVFNEYALQYFSQEDDLEAYLAYINRVAKKKNSVEEGYCGEKIYKSVEE